MRLSMMSWERMRSPVEENPEPSSSMKIWEPSRFLDLLLSLPILQDGYILHPLLLPETQSRESSKLRQTAALILRLPLPAARILMTPPSRIPRGR